MSRSVESSSSIAERLTALHEEQCSYGWPGPPVRSVFDALPQIAGVVAAAETIAGRTGAICDCGTEVYDGPKLEAGLADALAALEESLP